MCKVSVVIPVYNAEKTLRRCVDSILFGAYRDVEVILVDDCSHDGSWTLCQALSQQFENVLAIQNEKNCGVSPTRNRGLDAATGEYILFCDSDDWVSSDYVSTLVTQAEANPGMLVFCGFTKCYAVRQTEITYSNTVSDKVTREELFTLFDKELIHYVWNKCFRLKVIRDTGLRFDEQQYMGEDFQFVLDYMVASHSFGCIVINKSLYFYSQLNTQSLVSRWSRMENFEQAVSRIQQLAQITGNAALGDQKIRELKESYVYHISRDRSRTRKQRIQDIKSVMEDEKASHYYRRQRWLHFKEKSACLLGKIKNRIQSVKKLVPLWVKCPVVSFFSEFGRWPLHVVLVHMRRSFAQNGGCGDTGKRRAEQAAQKITYAWVRKNYSSVVEKHAKTYTLGEPLDNGTIWIFWWQGEEKAPVIVQRCIASIRKHAGGHPVQVVDQQNYLEFVSIPAHIEKKREQGVISLTHFSDYLRMALLAQHGGLWLDATIYAAGDLGEAFRDPVFTVRNPGQDDENISCWKWSGFALGARKQNILSCLMLDLFDAYWRNNKYLIDYFLIDYMMLLVYEKCENIRKIIDEIPANNPELYYYQKHFNDEASSQNTSSDTWMYKLSWKGQYFTHTKEGVETVYGAWLRETEDLICQK